MLERFSDGEYTNTGAVVSASCPGWIIYGTHWRDSRESKTSAHMEFMTDTCFAVVSEYKISQKKMG